MLLNNTLSKKSLLVAFAFMIASSVGALKAQDLRFGIYASPVISWFSTDISEVRNEGARAGLNVSATAEKYFGFNFALTGGISIINSSGRTVSENTTLFKFPNYTSVVAPENAIVYRIQYLSLPVGIKIKTNEIGFLSYFAETGFDPKLVIRGRADIPSLNIKGEKAMTEIKLFNLGYHLNGGIDYSLDGTTSLILGLGFESNFFDITKDTGTQPVDRTSHKLIKFIFGINF